MSHKPDGRLPLLSARPAVTLATHNHSATEPRLRETAKATFLLTGPHTHQYLSGVDGPDAGSEVPPEELAEVAVLGEVLDGSVLQTAAEHPDVEAQRGATQPRRQNQLVELAPQTRDELQRDLTIQRHLTTTITTV